MTPGERMIWAAAFVAAYNQRMADAVRLDAQTGALVHNERAAAFVPSLAVMDAARLVQVARDTLLKIAAADVKPGREQIVQEALSMLREMLGIDAAGAPYR